MGQQKKHAKGRMDKYYHMAKEQGFRARSAFKLIQLNKKYAFLERAKVLVDLCAAPGGWLQVAAKYMPRPSIIVGVDLAPIRPIPGVITHVEDITSARCRATLKAELKTWQADVFLHDGAPNVGTSWLQDAFTQAELSLSALKLATEFLAQGGTFVTKVFRSKDYNKLIWVFQQLFGRVEATKPASSRNVSAEIFVVCRDYLAPKKIDPRILDPKYAFKEIDDEVAAEDGDQDPELLEKKARERDGVILNELFGKDKRRRFRDGYEDGDYTLHYANNVVDFVRSSEFLSLLAKSHELKFLDLKRSKTGADSEKEKSNGAQEDVDEETIEMDRAIRESPLTTDEIREYFADLKVLGKREFKTLMAWRERVRETLGLETKASLRAKKREAEAAAVTAAAEAEKEALEDLDTILDREQEALESKARRDKKKQRERKAKQIMKLQLGMETPTEIGIEASKDGQLLPEVSLGVGNEKIAELFGHKTRLPKSNAADELDDSSDEEMLDGDESADEDDNPYDSDDERVNKLSRLEQQMDEMYEEYKNRMTERNPSATAKKRREGVKAEFEEWYGIENDKKMGLVSKLAADGEQDGGEGSVSSDDSEASEAEEAGPGRNGKRRSKTSAVISSDAPMSKKASVFYDNPIFDILKTAESDAEMSEDEQVIPSEPAKEANKTKKGKKSKNEMLAKFDQDDAEEVPEAVPMDDGESDDDENDAGDYVLDTAAKYALAQQLVSKSGRRELIDSAYNRYAFGDRDGLPDWFLEDENRHNKPSMPITKEAVDIIRQRMRALDTRPIKKIAEAKFRKQMRAQRRLEKMAKKADSMNENEDMTEKSKLEAISKMVSKAKAKKERSKTQVVVAKGANRARQGRPRGVKGRYKMVDSRLKKDMRSEKAKAGKKKGRK